MDDLTIVSDILSCLQWSQRQTPGPPRVARVEMGQATFDRLKAAARPEGAPSDSGWRPAGWVPPSPLGSLLGIPVVVCGGLGPGVWRVIDRDGEVIKEGTLRP